MVCSGRDHRRVRLPLFCGIPAVHPQQVQYCTVIRHNRGFPEYPECSDIDRRTTTAGQFPEWVGPSTHTNTTQQNHHRVTTQFSSSRSSRVSNRGRQQMRQKSISKQVASGTTRSLKRYNLLRVRYPLPVVFFHQTRSGTVIRRTIRPCTFGKTFARRERSNVFITRSTHSSRFTCALGRGG